MKRMLVSDYDGTFYVNDSQIQENIDAVNKFRNNKNLFVIATGNNYKHFLNVVQEKKIKYDYLILDQGSVISNKNDDIIYSVCLKQEIAQKIYYELKKIDKKNTLKVCGVNQEECYIDSDKITKILIKFDDIKSAQRTAEMLIKKYKNNINAYVMIFTSSYRVEIISGETDKEKAIKKIATLEGIKRNNIYTIGNGYNDISMINSFNGYCLNTSVDKLLKECNKHVDSVNELIYQLIKI